MKKNLRNLLVLSLGLITTIASAQWGASSTTWINNDEDNRSAVNRSTVTMDISAVHISSDYYWTSMNGVSTQYNANVYEAYASTDVMGFGTLTLGRQDLSFGSGALISSGYWGADRYVTDGADFAASFGGIDINAGTMSGISTASNYLNASGSFSGLSFNVLMIDRSDVKSHGYDLGYSLMDGSLNLNYSINDDGNGNEMTVMGGSYNVMDNVSINGSMRTYEGADGGLFSSDNSAWTRGTYIEDGVEYYDGTGGLAAGVLPHMQNGVEIMSYGLDYNLGDVSLGYTMHNASNDTGYEEDMTDMTLTYNLNDNCTLGYRAYKFEDVDYNFFTLQIGL